MKDYIKSIVNEADINEMTGEKIFDAFWKYVEKEIKRKGIAEIDGLGTFSLELDEKSKKEEYKIKFNPSGSFSSQILN
jgi:nucleoid DNA-binding protein